MFGSFFFSTCKKNIESTRTQAPSGRSDVEFVSTGRLRRPWSLCCIHWFRASQYAWPPAVFYKEHKRLGEIGGGKKTHEAHTCHLKRNHFKKTFHLNQPSIFSWYVSFQGMYTYIYNDADWREIQNDTSHLSILHMNTLPQCWSKRSVSSQCQPKSHFVGGFVTLGCTQKKKLHLDLFFSGDLLTFCPGIHHH